jgi:hypothetical protein
LLENQDLKTIYQQVRRQAEYSFSYASIAAYQSDVGVIEGELPYHFNR